MPFRQAHSVVGSLVRDSLQRGVPLAELVRPTRISATDALGLLEPGVAVTRRTSPGGAGPRPVAVQMERFRHRLDLDRQRVSPDAAAGARRRCRDAARGQAGRPAQRGVSPDRRRRRRRRRVPAPPRSTPAESLEVAPQLLNKLLVAATAGSGRIVEVEAYRGSEDPASHAFRGRPAATPSCSGPPGACTSTSPTGCTSAPTWCACPRRRPRRSCSGRWRRWRVSTPCAWPAPRRARDRELTSGPAKLCQAMGITRRRRRRRPGHRGRGARAGRRRGGTTDATRHRRAGSASARRPSWPWRWWVPGDPNVSTARALAGVRAGRVASGTVVPGARLCRRQRVAGSRHVAPL